MKPQRKQAAPVEQHYEVWEESWESLMMFLRMQTQWNVTMGGYVGLKYEVLLGAGGLMSLYDIENPRELPSCSVMIAFSRSQLYCLRFSCNRRRRIPKANWCQ